VLSIITGGGKWVEIKISHRNNMASAISCGVPFFHA